MDHPTLNALLNLCSAVLLVLAYRAVKQRNFTLHRNLMVGALASSAAFLTSYLAYHYQVGHTTCVATGWVRTLYFVILIPHVILAVLMVPPVLITVFLAFRDRRPAHRRIARITLPVWLYVSVTGVLVYLYVYHLFPGPEYFVPAGSPL